MLVLHGLSDKPPNETLSQLDPSIPWASEGASLLGEEIGSSMGLKRGVLKYPGTSSREFDTPRFARLHGTTRLRFAWQHYYVMMIAVVYLELRSFTLTDGWDG